MNYYATDQVELFLLDRKDCEVLFTYCARYYSITKRKGLYLWKSKEYSTLEALKEEAKLGVKSLSDIWNECCFCEFVDHSFQGIAQRFIPERCKILFQYHGRYFWITNSPRKRGNNVMLSEEHGNYHEEFQCA